MVVLYPQNSNARLILYLTAVTFAITSVALNCAYAADSGTIMPARYRLTEDGEDIGPLFVLFPDTFWTPTGSYCSEDHRDPDGDRYEHSHLPHGFPFDHDGTTVTAQMSDWAWDAYYAGQTRISNSTFSKNCFAYAEGAPTVMFAPGWFDFTYWGFLPCATSFGTVGHAKKLRTFT